MVGVGIKQVLVRHIRGDAQFLDIRRDFRAQGFEGNDPIRRFFRHNQLQQIAADIANVIAVGNTIPDGAFDGHFTQYGHFRGGVRDFRNHLRRFRGLGVHANAAIHRNCLARIYNRLSIALVLVLRLAAHNGFRILVPVLHHERIDGRIANDGFVIQLILTAADGRFRIALDGIELAAFHFLHQTNMLEAAGLGLCKEYHVALLGSVVIQINHVCLRPGHLLGKRFDASGSGIVSRRDFGIVGAESDEHSAPVIIRFAIPCAIAGIILLLSIIADDEILAAGSIAKLALRNGNDIVRPDAREFHILDGVFPLAGGFLLALRAGKGQRGSGRIAGGIGDLDGHLAVAPNGGHAEHSQRRLFSLHGLCIRHIALNFNRIRSNAAADCNNNTQFLFANNRIRLVGVNRNYQFFCGRFLSRFNDRIFGRLNCRFLGRFDDGFFGRLNHRFLSRFDGRLFGRLNHRFLGRFDGRLFGRLNHRLLGRFDGRLFGRLNYRFLGRFDGRLFGRLNHRFLGRFDGRLCLFFLFFGHFLLLLSGILACLHSIAKRVKNTSSQNRRSIQFLSSFVQIANRITEVLKAAGAQLGNSLLDFAVRHVVDLIEDLGLRLFAVIKGIAEILDQQRINLFRQLIGCTRLLFRFLSRFRFRRRFLSRFRRGFLSRFRRRLLGRFRRGFLSRFRRRLLGRFRRGFLSRFRRGFLSRFRRRLLGRFRRGFLSRFRFRLFFNRNYDLVMLMLMFVFQRFSNRPDRKRGERHNKSKKHRNETFHVGLSHVNPSFVCFLYAYKPNDTLSFGTPILRQVSKVEL